MLWKTIQAEDVEEAAEEVEEAEEDADSKEILINSVFP